MLCYVGLLFAAVQGGVIGRLIKPSHSTATSKDNNNNNGKDTEGKERIVIVTSFLLLSGSLFLWSIAWSPAMLLLALLPFSLSAGALNTLINSLITKVACLFFSPVSFYLHPLLVFHFFFLFFFIFFFFSFSFRRYSNMKLDAH